MLNKLRSVSWTPFKSDLNKHESSWEVVAHRAYRGSRPNPLQTQRLMSLPPHTAPDLHDSKPKVARRSEPAKAKDDPSPYLDGIYGYVCSIFPLFTCCIYRYAYTPLVAKFPFAFKLIPTLCNPTLTDTLWICSSGCNLPVHKLWS